MNFINLNTANSISRSREIGVRKVFGAARMKLVWQFFFESFVITVLSLALSILLVQLTLPFFNALSGKQLDSSLLLHFPITAGIVAITIATGVLSGLYPALYLSYIKPILALKGQKGRVSKFRFLKYSLILLQFSTTFVLIICSVIITRQLIFIHDSKFGYEPEGLVAISMRDLNNEKYESLKEALGKETAVMGVTRCSDLPSETGHYTMVSGWEESSTDQSLMMNYFSVDEDFLDAFHLEMEAGRFFMEDTTTDLSNGFVLNETAIHEMGLKDPIGKRFNFYGRDGFIIGVVKDFHFESLYQQIEPLILWIDSKSDRYLYVRLSSGAIADNLGAVESVYRQFNPEYPFSFLALDYLVLLP